MQYQLTLTKTTKRTYRYDNPSEVGPNSEVSTLYIQQTAFPNGAPESIMVTVEASDG